MYTIQDYHSKTYILFGFMYIVVDYDDKWGNKILNVYALYKKGAKE